MMGLAVLAERELLAEGVSASGVSSDVYIDRVSTEAFRKSAEFLTFPKAKLPDAVEDFGRSCAKLIWATFPGRSQNAVAEAAAQALGVSPDTIERVLGGRTKHPDPRVMFACLAIYQSRTGQPWPIGGGFEIRITQTGATK